MNPGSYGNTTAWRQEVSESDTIPPGAKPEAWRDVAPTTTKAEKRCRALSGFGHPWGPPHIQFCLRWRCIASGSFLPQRVTGTKRKRRGGRRQDRFVPSSALASLFFRPSTHRHAPIHLAGSWDAVKTAAPPRSRLYFLLKLTRATVAGIATSDGRTRRLLQPNLLRLRDRFRRSGGTER